MAAAGKGADKKATDPPEKTGKKSSSVFVQLFLVGFVFALLAPWTIWFFVMRDPGPTLDERLAHAEAAVQKGDNEEAKRQILLLKEAKFTEDNYGGILEYLVGVISFREAEEMDGLAAANMYRRAVSYLRSAEKKALPANYLPEKSFALGASLYRLGQVRECVPVLKVAWETFPREKARVGLYLADCEMNPNIELPTDELKAGVNRLELKYRLALNKNDVILQKNDFTPAEKMQALQQRVDLFIGLNQLPDAETALAEVEKHHQAILSSNPLASRENTSIILLKGKFLFAKGEYQKVIELFAPYLQHKNAYENDILRRAILITGECYEKLGNVDQAVTHYKYCTFLDEYDEMIPASLKIANLLRTVKDQHEQAYELYLRILKFTIDESSFNNSLISWSDIRTQMREAWKDWISTSQFRWAMDLSERLSPLFSKDDAYEMSALVSKSWAETLQEQYDKALYSQRETLYLQVVDHWKQAGQAFSLLAESRMTMASYPDALWNATLMFRKGNDFEHALKNIDLFLATQPRGLLPTALVLRGEILMDLHGVPPYDTLDQAIEVFQQVADEHPRDTAAFRARVNLGQAYLEKNDPENALKVWNRVLSQSELTPDAYEWRHSQFLLAKTLVNHVEELFYKIRQIGNTDPQTAKQFENQAYEQLESSVKSLREFLLRERNPASQLEAKDLLANALHKLALRAVAQLPAAETDNLRNELNSEIQQHLKEVLRIYKDIKIALQPGSAANVLNMQEQMILRNAYFMSGHIYYELAQYDESTDHFSTAIINYRDAVNYYPQDPQVLLAYYQMSNCYDRLGQPRQAKSYLEQARIILLQIPDSQFSSSKTNFTKEEWQKLLDQSLQLHETQTSSLTP